MKWKKSRIVLLRKVQKPANEPSSYRPLCLLNDVGKVYELLLVQRLERHLESSQSLADEQYGFRKGRSTEDAICTLEATANAALEKYELCVAVSLDIRNAFNSIGWDHIKAALQRCDVPEYQLQTFQAYFKERSATLAHAHSATGQLEVNIACGVLQGPVVGPTLWNVAYDRVLRARCPESTKIIGFADDTLVMAWGKTTEDVEKRVNEALEVVAEEISTLRLSLATEKSEAVFFKRQYKKRKPTIRLNGADVPITKTMKYLGLTIDENLLFREHMQEAALKRQRVLTSLKRLMPNIGGPTEPRRRLLVSVVQSVMLYGAPIWATSLEYSKASRGELLKVQRQAALRSICGYRTISYDATYILASTPPIDLIAMERRKLFQIRRGLTRKTVQEARDDTMVKWLQRIEDAKKGEWTRTLIRDVRGWVTRRHGSMDFHLTQVLSGHGCFSYYTHGIGKKADPTCRHCPSTPDDAHHTLVECRAWTTEREELEAEIGQLDVGTLIGKMLSNTQAWEAVSVYAKRTMR